MPVISCLWKVNLADKPQKQDVSNPGWMNETHQTIIPLHPYGPRGKIKTQLEWAASNGNRYPQLMATAISQ